MPIFTPLKQQPEKLEMRNYRRIMLVLTIILQLILASPAGAQERTTNLDNAILSFFVNSGIPEAEVFAIMGLNPITSLASEMPPEALSHIRGYEELRELYSGIEMPLTLDEAQIITSPHYAIITHTNPSHPLYTTLQQETTTMLLRYMELYRLLLESTGAEYIGGQTLILLNQYAFIGEGYTTTINDLDPRFVFPREQFNEITCEYVPGVIIIGTSTEDSLHLTTEDVNSLVATGVHEGEHATEVDAGVMIFDDSRTEYVGFREAAAVYLEFLTGLQEENSFHINLSMQMDILNRIMFGYRGWGFFSFLDQHYDNEDVLTSFSTVFRAMEDYSGLSTGTTSGCANPELDYIAALNEAFIELQRDGGETNPDTLLEAYAKFTLGLRNSREDLGDFAFPGAAFYSPNPGTTLDISDQSVLAEVFNLSTLERFDSIIVRTQPGEYVLSELPQEIIVWIADEVTDEDDNTIISNSQRLSVGDQFFASETTIIQLTFAGNHRGEVEDIAFESIDEY